MAESWLIFKMPSFDVFVETKTTHQIPDDTNFKGWLINNFFNQVASNG